MEKETKTDPTIINAIAVLSETYIPATDLADAAKRYTSDEIASAIHQLTGKQASNEIVFVAMSGEGYRYVIDETSTSVKYVWLLKYRTK